METRPWIEEDATELEKALLGAGRAEEPAVGSAARLASAILKAQPPIAAASGLRWWLAGTAMASVAVGLVAALMMTRSGGWAGDGPTLLPRAAPSGTLPLANPSVTKPTVAAPAEASFSVPPSPGRPPTVDDAPRVSPRNLVQGPAREVPLPRDALAPAQSLEEETLALDRVRDALKLGRATDALRQLDEFRQRFPRGRLRPESLVLRVAALRQSGNVDAADALGNQLLANPVYEAYSRKIRSSMSSGREKF
jgi:hypothetical protein